MCPYETYVMESPHHLVERKTEIVAWQQAFWQGGIIISSVQA